MRNRLGFLVLATALGITALAVMAQEAATSAPRVIEMTAGNYEFTPSSVHVKVGEAVEIKVTADDKEHGIRIKTVAKGRAKGANRGLKLRPDRTASNSRRTKPVRLLSPRRPRALTSLSAASSAASITAK